MISVAAKRYFGEDALDWLHRSYLLDWYACRVCLLWFFSYIISFWPVYEREFSHKDDSISHPHKPSQIGSVLNFAIALYVPLLFLIISGCKKRSLLEIHHGALALLAGRGLARLITEYLKHKVGRLRPDFLARCKWDKVAKLCTGKASDILDGRQSFPSGHSSTAFAGMVFLSLWIAGQTAGLCPSVTPSVKWLPSRMGTFILTFIPLFWAVHVAVTRVEDYVCVMSLSCFSFLLTVHSHQRHHKEDVIAGSLIGIVSAILCYLLFWPSPFHSKSFSASSATEPRDLYEARYQPRRAYELTAIEDENVVNNV
ncbi:Putative lipid phosphate phosphatase 3, chloroplastic [Leucoagaricus sp. SymC.cos]|nr:Putative lipid phosphate phosphatase 3, chloroplastic [Leucoagaricus sp. SymC.cos]